MRPRTIVLAGAAVLAIAGAVFWARNRRGAVARYQYLLTGDPQLDALAPLVAAAADAAGLDQDAARALVGIIHAESGGDPVHYVGDLDIPQGPSIGPGQVSRATAIDLGLVHRDTSPEEYLAYAHDDAHTVQWAALVLADKMARSHGDLSVAVRMYNGSGPSAAEYADRVAEFAAEKWG